MASDLNFQLSKKTHIFHLKVWVLLAIFVGLFIVIILLLLPFCFSRKKSRKFHDTLPISQIPDVSKEIRVDQNSASKYGGLYRNPLAYQDTYSEKDSDKLLAHSNIDKMKDFDITSQSDSFTYLDKGGIFESGENGAAGTVYHPSHPTNVPSPLSGLPEFSHLGWGHWFTLRDLETATNKFSKENIIGEGGYGIVYRGQLINGTEVAVKKLLNNL